MATIIKLATISHNYIKLIFILLETKHELLAIIPAQQKKVTNLKLLLQIENDLGYVSNEDIKLKKR